LKNSEEEKKEIIQPSASTRRRFMFAGDKSNLEHPRKTLWKWMFSYLKSFRGKFSLYLVLLLIGTIISALSPIISASIIDRGIISGDTNFVLLLSSIYIALVFLLAIATYISQYGMGKISQKVTYEIRNNIFFKLQNMSLSYFDKRSSGNIISIATNDVTILNQLVGGYFVQIITSFVSIFLTIIFMFILNPFLALISMIIFPLFFIITNLFKKVAFGLFKESRKTIGKVTSSIQENIAGAKVVKAYGQEERASSEFDDANKANYYVMVKIRRYMATIFPLISLISTVLTAGVLLAGGIVTIRGVSVFGITISVGVLSAYVTILGQFFRPFMTLMQIQQIIESAMAASDRIYTLLEEEAEIPDPINPNRFDKVEGCIEVSNVSFGYAFNNKGDSKLKIKKTINTEVESRFRDIPSETIVKMIKFLERSMRSISRFKPSKAIESEGRGMITTDISNMAPQSILRILAQISIPSEIFEQIPKKVKDAINEEKTIIQYEHSTGFVLRDFSLKIPAGITLAIVGETGAGKTTVTKLITRFYDVNSGKIQIDGLDIQEVTKKDLRDLIGLVPQDAFLFTGTIRENLLYAFDDFTPEIEDKMIKVSKFLGLHNFIETLYKKYDTVLKENGSNISIGQRQLIAFARALITDPKILILDEATSSVDPYTESLIQDALNKARKGRTTIIIAHRLSTIKNADLIIVLSAGKKGIIEQGDHESLLALNGKYKRLLEMQHREIEVDN